jgi:hypothetical protein
MSGDEFIEGLRRANPAPKISEARIDALIEDTLRRAQSIPQRRVLFWPKLLPVMQYALPMVVAVVVGVAVDRDYKSELPVAQFSSVLLSSSLIPSGS